MRTVLFYSTFIFVATRFVGCSNVRPVVDDDVYMLKSADLPIGENLVDETSYTTYKYRQNIDQKTNGYYNPARQTIFSTQTRRTDPNIFMTNPNNIWYMYLLYNNSNNNYKSYSYVAASPSIGSRTFYRPRGTSSGIYSGNNRISSNTAVNSPIISKPATVSGHASQIRSSTPINSTRTTPAFEKPVYTRPTATPSRGTHSTLDRVRESSIASPRNSGQSNNGISQSRQNSSGGISSPKAASSSKPAGGRNN